MKKVIIVTGASSGIGKATALQLIKEGHAVYGIARRLEKMQDLVEAGGSIIEVDITNEENVKNCINQIIEEQDRIDVLINNAGYAVYGPVETVSLEDARRQFDVNLFGLAYITQQVIPHMRRAQSGKIINLSSVGGKAYSAYGAWYHATKYALEGWSDCLRLELDPLGIDVVIIEPGLIKTELGGIMNTPFLNRIKNTPYEKTAIKMAKYLEDSFTKPNGASPPSVIANVISKAIQASKPKTRYAAGKMAKISLLFYKLTSSRMYDKILMSQINK